MAVREMGHGNKKKPGVGWRTRPLSGQGRSPKRGLTAPASKGGVKGGRSLHYHTTVAVAVTYPPGTVVCGRYVGDRPHHP
jgi:hypothetical protein